VKLRILLAVFGLFALGSGLMKSRARVRERMGGAGLGVIEGFLGFVLLISQGPNMANEGLRTALAWTTLGVMAVSNAYAVLRARNFAEERRDSEGHRLYTQIKFQQALEMAEADAPERPGESPDDVSPEGPSQDHS
jgi:hypothetical protein